MPYCIYLRKSRADAEAEAHGEGETLARHEHALLELARRLHLDITQIYREVVSGETISARPVMQRLLAEVEDRRWDGVLVMEVERLARGDTIDQGVVSRAFTISGTRIITPAKTYDPHNEFDTEYFEFGLFMSRREYQTIKRRLERGREASVKEGKYVGNIPPYGYRRVKLAHEKGFVLEPDPDEAPAVRLMFDWYVHGAPGADGRLERIGCNKIARRLDDLHFPTRSGKPWSSCSVSDMLTNPVYAGYIVWGHRRNVRHVHSGNVSRSRPKADDYLKTRGRHEPLIEEPLFDQAQALMSKNPPRPTNTVGVIANPLAGLVICSVCGRHMVRRPPGIKNPADTLMCPNRHCSTVSAPIVLVEDRVLKTLNEWVNADQNAAVRDDAHDRDHKKAILDTQLKHLTDERNTCDLQRARIHDLLEQGVYTVEVFLERSRALTAKAEQLDRSIEETKAGIADAQSHTLRLSDLIPLVRKVLNTYADCPSPKGKNDLLRKVVAKAVYAKSEKARRGGDPGTFSLEVIPNLEAPLQDFDPQDYIGEAPATQDSSPQDHLAQSTTSGGS